MKPILDGVRVLDFGHFIAGPFCGALLADFGADVIRVERPQGANDRFLVPLSEPPNVGGALYQQVNRNKRSLALDTNRPEGIAVATDLIRQADVVIANFPDRVLRALKLDYATLSAIKPDIILCTCNAYGGVDSLSDKPGFDGIGQALSGAMEMTGDPTGPRKAYAHYVDFSTAALSAFGVALSLMKRTQTGKGDHVRTSLLHTALSIMNSTLIEASVTGVDRRGTGNRAQLAGPADCFATRDGHILVQVVGGSMFRRIADVVGHPEWLTDRRFTTDETRGENGAVLSGAVADWCRTRTTQECIAALEAAGLPAAPVVSPIDVMADPAVAGRGFFSDVSVPGVAKPVPVAGSPVALASAGASEPTVAPALGAHSREVLQGIGYGASAIQGLIDRGVVLASDSV